MLLTEEMVKEANRLPTLKELKDDLFRTQIALEAELNLTKKSQCNGWIMAGEQEVARLKGQIEILEKVEPLLKKRSEIIRKRDAEWEKEMLILSNQKRVIMKERDEMLNTIKYLRGVLCANPIHRKEVEVIDELLAKQEGKK